MTPIDQIPSPITPADEQLVLASLEPGQLAALKKHPVPRRQLKGIEKFVLLSLRIYLLFMMAVVLYQVWLTLH